MAKAKINKNIKILNAKLQIFYKIGSLEEQKEYLLVLSLKINLFHTKQLIKSIVQLTRYYYIILETVNCNDVITLLYKQYNLFEMYVIVYTKCHVTIDRLDLVSYTIIMNKNLSSVLLFHEQFLYTKHTLIINNIYKFWYSSIKEFVQEWFRVVKVIYFNKSDDVIGCFMRTLHQPLAAIFFS
ncbi:hypothetical protein AGLY_005419 [Aphis glycines]|uniref:Uncharacterized protein n=1 Tax=Aphis glycines TaxID=307491 RepID=A0A6G0TUV4_APHGL|nr:hypothetical protein AGLY_005419 [Aphis glycines]